MLHQWEASSCCYLAWLAVKQLIGPFRTWQTGGSSNQWKGFFLNRFISTLFFFFNAPARPGGLRAAHTWQPLISSLLSWLRLEIRPTGAALSTACGWKRSIVSLPLQYICHIDSLLICMTKEAKWAVALAASPSVGLSPLCACVSACLHFR